MRDENQYWYKKNKLKKPIIKTGLSTNRDIWKALTGAVLIGKNFFFEVNGIKHKWTIMYWTFDTRSFSEKKKK